MIIVDGHEDLGLNALADGRNYMLSAYRTRELEAAGSDEKDNGLCMLGLPEWQRARTALIFATITAIPRSLAKPTWLSYTDSEEAHQQGLSQLEIYREWSSSDARLSIVTSHSDIDRILNSWAGNSSGEIGLILLIENADLIREPAEVERWYRTGVRIVGPSWHSNRYAASHRAPGPLTPYGRELLA